MPTPTSPVLPHHRFCPVRAGPRAGPASAVTRMFSPCDRVPEDPACGSAAGPLAAHLVRHGRLASGAQITLSQGEAVGRPSTLHAEAAVEADQITSIRVGGGVGLIGSG
ncbi:PhzF family phenazine biosynthesis protein [Streptomyces sp. bgisy060]|uniref:PhzF family phenazine biosynthesis protein n=1 Tax=Streptomyces sp. bgisy060 TaxID=3413775 RepID=UPI003EB811A9